MTRRLGKALPPKRPASAAEVLAIAGSLVVILAVVMLAVVGAALLTGPSTTRAGVSPYWDNIAGAANRACYHDGGVQQITSPGSGSGNQDAVAVCRDGWAMDLTDTPWWP
jgi:hypothetical protein